MKNLKEFPVLEANRLLLRELREEDLYSYHRLFSNESVLEFYGMKPKKEPEELIRRLKRTIKLFPKKGIRFAICLKSDDNLIGTIGFKNWDSRSKKAEVSYDLSPKYWNKGYMTEALQAVTDFGFRYDLNRIEAWVMTENEASARVLKKCGYKSEGVHRESMVWAGKYRDLEWFSILKSEWSK